MSPRTRYVTATVINTVDLLTEAVESECAAELQCYAKFTVFPLRS